MLHRVLMGALCCQRFRPHRCLVTEYYLLKYPRIWGGGPLSPGSYSWDTYDKLFFKGPFSESNDTQTSSPEESITEDKTLKFKLWLLVCLVFLGLKYNPLCHTVLRNSYFPQTKKKTNFPQSAGARVTVHERYSPPLMEEFGLDISCLLYTSDAADE